MQHMGQWNNGTNVLQRFSCLPKKGLIFYVELILIFSKITGCRCLSFSCCFA